MWFNKILTQLQGYNQLEETSEIGDSDNIMKDTLKVILDIYILAQG
jgi:hypothetical protein